MEKKPESQFGETIYKYTSDQAEADGVLFDITKVNSDWEKGIFKFVTTNMLEKLKYVEGDKLNIPNLLDLLNQANQIVRKASNNFTREDHFFEGYIETPDGDEQQIFMGLNEFNKFTIMLPEDY